MYLKRKQEKQGLNLKNWFYMGVDGVQELFCETCFGGK